jgi:hypothetical protein
MQFGNANSNRLRAAVDSNNRVVTTKKSASFVRASMKLGEKWMQLMRQEARKQNSELGLGAQKKIRGQPGKN